MKRFFSRSLVCLVAAGLLLSVNFASAETISGTMSVDSGNSTLGLDVTLDVIVDLGFPFGTVSDIASDDDSSAVSGTIDADFDWEFNAATGNIQINSFSMTDGALSLDDGIQLIIPLKFSLLNNPISLVGSNLTGIPSTTSPPSILTTPATTTTNGEFNPMDHEVFINSGHLHGEGNNIDDIDIEISDLPGGGFSGASTSPNPGIITLVKNSEDTQANTSNYSITMTLPVEFSEFGIVVVDSNAANAIADVEVDGLIVATLANFDLPVIATNGVIGDVNQDDTVDSLDIDAFIAGWRSTNETPGKLAYMLGDMNFDGITDLFDAFILHEALDNAGVGGFNIGALVNGVPEPSTGILFLLGTIGILGVRRVRKK